MTEIYQNVFVGSEQDYYSIQRPSDWATLHCCKNPFHCDFVGYRGSLSPSHPDYALKYKDKGYRLLIHCNQGESRAPTLGMLYVARFGAFNYVDFNASKYKLRSLYPSYNPKQNIYMTVKSLWSDFVIVPLV